MREGKSSRDGGDSWRFVMAVEEADQDELIGTSLLILHGEFSRNPADEKPGHVFRQQISFLVTE